MAVPRVGAVGGRNGGQPVTGSARSSARAAARRAPSNFNRINDRSKNPGDEAPADFGAILLVAGEMLSQKGFFVRQSPNKAKGEKHGWDEIPIGAKRESHSHKEDCSTRIHGISYHSIGSRRHHFLVRGDLNSRGAKRVFFKDEIDQPETDCYEDVTSYGKPGRHTGPSETVVKPGKKKGSKQRNPH